MSASIDTPKLVNMRFQYTVLEVEYEEESPGEAKAILLAKLDNLGKRIEAEEKKVAENLAWRMRMFPRSESERKAKIQTDYQKLMAQKDALSAK